MGDAWLDEKLREALPSESERRMVRDALDRIEACLEAEGGALRIAERYPCGSFAKSTMLAGRREADLVVILREAPTDKTLEDLEAVLVRSLSPEWSAIRHKAVSLGFSDGVKVDLLPVAKEGVTEASPEVPEKLRNALSGPLHVDWFKREAHNTPIHPTVCLLKLFRSTHAAWKALGSFSIEVLAVDLLRDRKGGLVSHFKEVLSKIAGGYLEDKVLSDPANAANDILRNVGEDARARVADEARAVLPAIESGTWSAVFQGVDKVLPSSNLGGSTLA
jgi:hypothetical protein